LRPGGYRARLVLPEDFGVLDAERLCRVVHSIALREAAS
jgi:hypothetical protein